MTVPEEQRIGLQSHTPQTPGMLAFQPHSKAATHAQKCIVNVPAEHYEEGSEQGVHAKC